MIKKISYAELDQSFLKMSLKDFDLRFRNLFCIGSGGGSTIYNGVDTFNRNKNVAIKMYNNLQLLEENRIDIIRQIQILKYLKDQGPNQVVQFYDAFKISKSEKIAQYCIVMELCERSLHQQVIDEAFTKVSYMEKLNICKSLCESVLFLHSRSVIHRDIKPGNFLVSTRDGKKVYLLADFGQSKVFSFGVENSQLRGTIIFTNPQHRQSRDYTIEPDLFSLALTFVFVLTGGKYLFNIGGLRKEDKIKEQMQKQLKNIRQGLDKFQVLTENTKIFLEKCLNSSLKSIQQMRRELCQVIHLQKIEKEDIKKMQKNSSEQLQKQEQQNIKPCPMMKKKKDTANSTLPSEESGVHDYIDSFRQIQTKQSPKLQEKSISQQINFSLSKSEVSINQELNTKKSSSSSSSTSRYNRSFTLDVLNENSTKKTEISNVDLSFIKENKRKLSKTSLQVEKFDLMKNCFIAKKSIESKLENLTEAIGSLSNLYKFKQKLQTFKAIQEEKLEPAQAKKLMLICLKHLIMQVKNQQAGLTNANSVKYYKKFQSNLQGSYNKLHKNFSQEHARSQKNEFLSFLTKNDLSLSDIKQQFRVAVTGFNNILSSRKLHDILK